MCVVSMLMDHYKDKWTDPFYPRPIQPSILPSPVQPWPPIQPQISPLEVEEFKKLLERAREYDRKNNEPDCELEEKKQQVKKLAEDLGVKIDFL